MGVIQGLAQVLEIAIVARVCQVVEVNFQETRGLVGFDVGVGGEDVADNGPGLIATATARPGMVSDVLLDEVGHGRC